ncbi:hypothetical protein [Hymenobacter koreensis]|uniref:Uncharacterized protein n=1 Tax=Hymenobacter koreensis TaxID=1084523 RepID=A0ABP8JKP8_9BACT
MKRLTFLALLMGLSYTAAHAQTATKKTTKSTTTKAAKADDGWGPVTETPAPAPKTEQATTAPAQAQSQNSGADAGSAGGWDGAYGSNASTPSRVEGMSVAPGSPLLPSTRSRSDYMGRPIKYKPSTRPRSQDYSNGIQ